MYVHSKYVYYDTNTDGFYTDIQLPTGTGLGELKLDKIIDEMIIVNYGMRGEIRQGKYWITEPLKKEHEDEEQYRKWRTYYRRLFGRPSTHKVDFFSITPSSLKKTIVEGTVVDKDGTAIVSTTYKKGTQKDGKIYPLSVGRTTKKILC